MVVKATHGSQIQGAFAARGENGIAPQNAGARDASRRGSNTSQSSQMSSDSGVTTTCSSSLGDDNDFGGDGHSIAKPILVRRSSKSCDISCGGGVIGLESLAMDTCSIHSNQPPSRSSLTVLFDSYTAQHSGVSLSPSAGDPEVAQFSTQRCERRCRQPSSRTTAKPQQQQKLQLQQPRTDELEREKEAAVASVEIASTDVDEGTFDFFMDLDSSVHDSASAADAGDESPGRRPNVVAIPILNKTNSNNSFTAAMYPPNRIRTRSMSASSRTEEQRLDRDDSALMFELEE